MTSVIVDSVDAMLAVGGGCVVGERSDLDGGFAQNAIRALSQSLRDHRLDIRIQFEFGS